MNKFENAIKIIEQLGYPDNSPLRDCLPGVWPTVGDLKELIASRDGEVMLKALVDELERWNDMQEDDRIGGRPITGHTYHVLSNAKKFLIKRGIDG